MDINLSYGFSLVLVCILIIVYLRGFRKLKLEKSKYIAILYISTEITLAMYLFIQMFLQMIGSTLYSSGIPSDYDTPIAITILLLFFNIISAWDDMTSPIENDGKKAEGNKDSKKSEVPKISKYTKQMELNSIKNIANLKSQIKKIDELYRLDSTSNIFYSWKVNTEICLTEAFGENSVYVKKFNEIVFNYETKFKVGEALNPSEVNYEISAKYNIYND